MVAGSIQSNMWCAVWWLGADSPHGNHDHSQCQRPEKLGGIVTFGAYYRVHSSEVLTRFLEGCHGNYGGIRGCGGCLCGHDNGAELAVGSELSSSWYVVYYEERPL
jgi:hypothetical protein